MVFEPTFDDIQKQGEDDEPELDTTIGEDPDIEMPLGDEVADDLPPEGN